MQFMNLSKVTKTPCTQLTLWDAFVRKLYSSSVILQIQVATFIMQKILLDEVGLAYICQTHERFAHVAAVLGKVVIYLARDWSLRLMKHVIRCYLRLCDDPRSVPVFCLCILFSTWFMFLLPKSKLSRFAHRNDGVWLFLTNNTLSDQLISQKRLSVQFY